MSLNPQKKSRIPLLDQEAMSDVAAKVLSKMIENPGMTLKEATGVSDEVLEEIYHLAYSFYNQGKYDEATALFELLAGTCPTIYKYVFGLAACHHQKGSYEEAAAGFFLAFKIQPDNPMPAYYVTDCFLKQNLTGEALEFAELTTMICEDRPEFAILSQRCQLIIENLKNKKIS